MNNNFKQLLERFSDEWESVINTDSLDRLQDAYTNSESTREEILTWIFENISDEELQGEYFTTFGEFESTLVDDSNGIPVFDESFDIYESFDEYESYYQRYGCLTPEFVVSWDTENILFDDGDGNIEIVARPDVLMGNTD
jgi:hypothetical protein